MAPNLPETHLNVRYFFFFALYQLIPIQNARMHYLYFVHYLKCKQYLCFETFTVQANYNSLATNITHYANSHNVKSFFLKHFV